MADAFVSVLLEQLASITYQQIEKEVRLVVEVEKEVAKITSNLKAIQAVLEDAEKRQVKEAIVRDWLEKLKDVSYEMDDVLDEWTTEILIQQVDHHQQGGEGSITSTAAAAVTKKKIEDFVQLRLMCLGISYSHPVISPSRISSLLFFFIPQLLKRFSRNIGKVEACNLIGCDLFAVGQIEGECERMLNLCLIITWCRILSQSCEDRQGPEWSKISHIPNIQIDGKKMEFVSNKLIDLIHPIPCS